MNLLSRLLPPKIAEPVSSLASIALTYAVAHYGLAVTWVQIAVGVAGALGVSTVTNSSRLAARRAAKAAPPSAPAKGA